MRACMRAACDCGMRHQHRMWLSSVSSEVSAELHSSSSFLQLSFFSEAEEGMAEAALPLYGKVCTKRRAQGPFPLLEPLLSQGLPEHRAQKALAATGWKGAEEAADWIRSHHDDPSLDDPIPQEYALYLCPSGPLCSRLQEFWMESLRQCSRNQAHESFPHVTLCDFFTCEDRKVEALYKALKKAGDLFVSSFPSVISLSLHSSSSYIGFFISDGTADVLKRFAMAFATEASVLTDCHVKASSKQLHLTLAHKFSPHHQWTLEKLAKSITPTQTCQWAAALYSRDMRFVHYQTLRSLYQYTPQNGDELRLNPGDLVFVDRSDQAKASDGWMTATSHQTGCRGFVPQNYVERVSESEAWVRQRVYEFTPVLGLSPSLQKGTIGRINKSEIPLIARSVSRTLDQQLACSLPARRRLLVVRHGERVDQVFGKSWVQQCFTAEGESLLEQGLTLSAAYSAPALRCVQTAHHILRGLKMHKTLAIRTDPGLSEWTKWESSREMPPFMTVPELLDAGYNVDANYIPSFSISSLAATESYADFTNRCTAVMKLILRYSEHQAGDILIVGHGSALDSLTRPILGLPPTDSNDFAQMVRKVPSLATCCCVEDKEAGGWQIVEPPVKALTHGANSAFHWKNIL